MHDASRCRYEYFASSNHQTVRNGCANHYPIRESHFRLIYSQWLLGELAEKLELRRIRVKHNISQIDINTFFAVLLAQGEQVEPERIVNVCRDADDNHVIEAALAGNAEFVVTGDEDLLVLKQFETVRFITPREFLAILDEREQN
jgi:uncharacterized protein